MRVWLITIGEPLPTDGTGRDRLYRAGILSEMLAAGGHEVVWWTSTFDHVRKRQRFPSDQTVRLESGVKLILLHACGYRRNVSLRRILDHFLLAVKFSRRARKMEPPDVILCSLPPLDLPAVAGWYGRKYLVPVVVDVRDLWPDIFAEAIPRWTRFLSGLVLGPMHSRATTACRRAFAITGNTASFVNWGLARAGRPATPLDRPFPFGYAVPRLTERERREALLYWERQGLPSGDDVFTICFLGALSNQFDLETVIDAVAMVVRRGVRCRLVICGAGERLESLRARAVGFPFIIFTGWVGRAEIWTLMARSHIGIAPYRNHVGFVGNLPNKPIEYMAAGLPVLSTLQGKVAELLDEQDCGLTFLPGDTSALCTAMQRLYEDRPLLVRMSANARRVFSEHFSADMVYGEMITYLMEVTESFHATARSALAKKS